MASKKTTKTATPKNGARTPQGTSILTMDPPDLETAVASAMALLDEMETQLAGLVQYSTDERVHTTGKLRDGESAALTNIVSTVAQFPGLFDSLSDKDGGGDDATLETDPTSAMLERLGTLKPLAEGVAQFAQKLTDTALSMGASVRELTTPAYGIIRANAPINPKLSAASAPARTFYGDIGRKGARTKGKAAAAAAKAKP